MARKTHTSSEVKTRWNTKTYRRYTISLRYDTDQELIDYLEAHSETGVTELFRRLLQDHLSKSM